MIFIRKIGLLAYYTYMETKSAGLYSVGFWESVNYSDPTLDDMLFFLSRISVIPKTSEAYLLCDQIRKNRNDAVHNFKESSDDARQTFPKLIHLCDDLLSRSSRINNAHAATTWTNPSLRQRADSVNYFNEPESAYCVSESASSYNAKSNFVMAFEECMRDFNH